MSASGIATRIASAKRTGIALLLAGAVAISSCAGNVVLTKPPTPEPPLLLAVSTELASRLPAWADLWPMSLETKVMSTQSALDLVSVGFADAALVWGPEPTMPEGTVVVPVATDALAVVVNPANHQGPVTKDDLRALFSGQTQDWAAWGQSAGAVQLVVREDGSGPRRALLSLVMKDKKLSSSALIAASDMDVLDYVAKHQGAVGIIAASNLQSKVRPLAVNDERPEPKAVHEGHYPLLAGIWLIYRQDGRGAALADFLKSAAGQELLAPYFAPPDLLTQ